MSKKLNNYSCFLISNKPDLYTQVVKKLKKEKVNFFDGTNVKSFARLVNSCVEQAKTEIVILMSDKMRPTDENIYKTLDLLQRGFGFVGLYRFGFFGFKKELFRKIGPLDERFVGGCFEDDDFYIRMCEANIAVYLSQEVEYLKNPSSWDHSLSQKHFYEKWGIQKEIGYVYRKLQESDLNYDFGPMVGSNFLQWRESKFLAKKIKKYESLRVINE